MNTIARKEAEAMGPNQIDLGVGSKQQSTQNVVEEGEEAPSEDPVEIRPEIQPELQAEIPRESPEESEEEHQEPAEVTACAKEEELPTVTTR
jgi:hypothetical protein